MATKEDSKERQMMAFIFLLMATDYPETQSPCVIDVCEEKVCTVETPEGWVSVPKRPYYEEGMRIECPFWLIDPT
jgi:hypothetical protein